VPRQRRDQEHARLRRRTLGQVLREAQQRAERRARDDLLVHGDHLRTRGRLDTDLVDGEGEPFVGDRAVDEDLMRRAEAADGVQVAEWRRQQVEALQRHARCGTRPVERDALCLICGIQHADSPYRPQTAVERCTATSAITR
jgi:hypothetical protein